MDIPKFSLDHVEDEAEEQKTSPAKTAKTTRGRKAAAKKIDFRQTHFSNFRGYSSW